MLCVVLLAFFASSGCAYTPVFETEDGDEISNSIALMDEVVLGDVLQSLLIRGENVKKPLLLFLHGGPGYPVSPLSHEYQRKLEKYFIVVQWDQRGGGKSYGSVAPEFMTREKFLSDTHELILLLLDRYKKEKLYLVGHSWGSYLGIITANLYPELIHAYIGTGQMVDLLQQETLSHQFLVNEAKVRKNDEAIEELAGIGFPPYKDIVTGMKTKYNWLVEFGGFLYEEDSLSLLITALLTAPEYSLIDMINYIRGISFSLEEMVNNADGRFWSLSPINEITELKVPVYFISGEQDQVTPVKLISRLCEKIKAPKKRLLVLSDTGHFAFFRKSKEFTQIMASIAGQESQKIDGQIKVTDCSRENIVMRKTDFENGIK